MKCLGCFALSIGVTLTGCVDMVWVKPDTTAQTAWLDREQCRASSRGAAEMEARMAAQRAESTWPYIVQPSPQENWQNDYQTRLRERTTSCMMSRGYQLVERDKAGRNYVEP